MLDQSLSSASCSTLFSESPISSQGTRNYQPAFAGAPSMRSSSPSLQKEMECVEERNIQEADILCGKDKKCIKHPGSRDFRALIDGYSEQYQQAQTRQEKMDITKEIFDKLENHRFLKFDEEQQVWQTLHPLAVRDKIGHALRFSNRKGQGVASSAKRKIRRCPSASSQSTTESYESRISSSYRSLSPVSSGRNSSRQWAPCAEYYEMMQLAAKMDIREIKEDTTSNCYNQQPRLPSLVSFPNEKSESVLDYSSLDHDDTDGDLSWILQIPLLEVNPETKKIYFVKQA